ncbi:MAG: DUF1501 domain-containing protein [Chlorobi bacterium]|nr:DUF1501 domain-containing protein [Chlorobiota bacterium]
MKRRDFLKVSSPLIALPLVLGGFPVHALGRSRLLDPLWRLLATTDRVLVLIQLNGGNDGINTVIPLDQLSTYHQLRPQIALPDSTLIRITDEAALHPAMSGIQRMFADGMVAIVQGVAYPNTNLSHFRSTDIWMTASDYNQYLATGWMGRYLDTLYPNYPTGYPNSTAPDPPAVQIGAIMALALQGPLASMGLALQDPQTFYDIINGTNTSVRGDIPDTQPGHELAYLRQVELTSQQYSTSIKSAADKAQNKATYPSNNTLADQLKIVARLIAGGLQSRVYLVSLGGFDTHAAQVDTTDTTQGAHATLLGRLSDAVVAFFDDLRQLGVADRVVAMTFSEFGRRVASNASYGTDHGTAAPMFVFGTHVVPGIRGTNPSLTELDRNGNLLMQYDFRQVYSSILAQWYGADDATLRQVMLKDFQTIPIIRSSTTTSVEESPTATGSPLTISPNPAAAGQTLRLAFTIPAPGDVVVEFHDGIGRSAAQFSLGTMDAGTHQISIPVPSVAKGTLVCSLRAGNTIMHSRVIVE